MLPKRTLAIMTGTLLVLGLVGGLTLVGCGGGGGSGGGQTGRLQVSITDQAGAYQNVVISIREIRVVPTGDEEAPTGAGLPVIATFDPPKVVDVLTLAFQADRLADAVVPAGTYNQVRLVLARNEGGAEPVNYVTLISDPDKKIPLRTPSGQQSGLKLVGRFTVEPGVLNPIVLDFNPEKAIVQTGNGRYLLKPTGIRIVQLSDPLTTYGAFSGILSPAEARATGLVEVVPEAGGDPVASVQVDPDDGFFRIFVPGGSYYVHASADEYDPFVSDLQTIDVKQEIDLGEIVLTVPPPAP